MHEEDYDGRINYSWANVGKAHFCPQCRYGTQMDHEELGLIFKTVGSEFKKLLRLSVFFPSI